MSFERRTLLKATAGMTLFAGLGVQAAWAAGPLAEYPFTLGVASGDPWPDGFVLWTRLAPRPLEAGSGMPTRPVPVDWEVAEDEGFTRIVQTGVAVARPELGHSVHVEVAGLKSARPYWYRFRAGGEASPVGRVRTAPAAGAPATGLRLGVAGCQHYESGLFTAYRYLSQEADLDAVFHYGDYIYEGSSSTCSSQGGRRNCVRLHVGPEIYTLDDYRRRYAQYKSDPDLQAAHASTAFLMSFDDHEVDNNWAAALDQDGTPPEAFLLRRFAAMQAWYENMPVRRAQFPAAGGLTLHRRLDFGDLLRVHVLDTRQYRSDQLCDLDQTANCRPPTDKATATMLGDQQEAWLGKGLDGKARWNLLAQQVMVMPFRYPEGRKAGDTNLDSWSGYPEARQRLIGQIDARRLQNVVIATGDVHKHHAGVVPRREGDLDGPAAATEFVTTSIASGGDGEDMPTGWETAAANNPQSALFNGRRGYQVFNIGRDQWRTDIMTVDRVSTPGGRLTKLASVSVEPGKPGLHKGG